MTITVKDKQDLLIPPRVQRAAGFKAGDEVELKASGGIITVIPKLPLADDEYTPAQRRAIDDEIAKSLEDVKNGRIHGPFNTVDEMIASMKVELKKRAAKKSKRT